MVAQKVVYISANRAILSVKELSGLLSAIYFVFPRCLPCHVVVVNCFSLVPKGFEIYRGLGDLFPKRTSLPKP